MVAKQIVINHSHFSCRWGTCISCTCLCQIKAAQQNRARYGALVLSVGGYDNSGNSDIFNNKYQNKLKFSMMR